MTDETRAEPKKKYETPKVTVISLRPEEAVLGHCKSPSASGPVGANCAVSSCTVSGSYLAEIVRGNSRPTTHAIRSGIYDCNRDGRTAV